MAQLAELPAILKENRPFRRYVTGLSCAALGTMSNGFLVVYAVSELGAPDDLAAWYTAALLVSQTVASMVLGWLADRFSFRMVGIVSAVGTAAQGLVALLAPSGVWLLAAFVLLGAVQSGSMLARMSGPDRLRPPRASPDLCRVVRRAGERVHGHRAADRRTDRRRVWATAGCSG